MADVYLGLGANLGNRKLNLKKALEALSSRVEIIKVSPIYETDPVGFTEQPPFPQYRHSRQDQTQTENTAGVRQKKLR